MSAAAEQVRAETLALQAQAAVRRAENLAARLETWWDADIDPPAALVAAYEAAIAVAERIGLERLMTGEAAEPERTQ